MKKIFSLLLCAVLTFSMLALSGCGNKNDDSNRTDTPANNNGAVNQLDMPAVGDEIAVMHTNHGDITLRFFPEVAPKAVENFITHSRDGYYDGLTFHRVMKDFMIQGGDPTGTGMGGESIWGESFKDEYQRGLYNFRGALSMANAGANTNGSQFFIVQTKNVNESSLAALEQAGVSSEVIAKYREARRNSSP